MSDQLTLRMRVDGDASLDNFRVRATLQLLEAKILDLQAGKGESLFLWGPEGVGKSHLLQAISRSLGSQALYLPFSEIIQFPADAVLDGVAQSQVVLFDDVHLVSGRADWQEGLFHTYNRLKTGDILQIYSARQAPAAMVDVLPDLRSRWSELTVYHMPAYSESELGALLRFRAARRGLKLSDEVVSYILARAPRSASALMALLENLDQAAMAQGRSITIPLLNELKLLSMDR